MSSTSSSLGGYMRDRRASIASTLAALQSIRRPVFTPRRRCANASVALAATTPSVLKHDTISAPVIEVNEEMADFEMATVHSERGGDTVDMAEVEGLVYANHADDSEDEDESVFVAEVQSLLTLASATASSSSSSFGFDSDDEEDDKEDKTVDLWADEDTADWRAHFAEGWRVPRPDRPLGKRRRVQERAHSVDEESSDEEEGMEEDEKDAEDAQEVGVTGANEVRPAPELPVKQLPKRARIGDVVYSSELTQSIPLGFNSRPTFTRPVDMQGIQTSSVGSTPRSLPSQGQSIDLFAGGHRRVFYAPGEVVPSW
ncbi:unnamed protein product [Peniophora sp. CBMAI 1063]|nr:unnamed protein product [Peniophora sp. CBMAI 1063]